MPLASGWLNKRGGGHWSRQFRMRWFVLERDSDTLRYYKTPPLSVSTSAKGEIALRGATVTASGTTRTSFCVRVASGSRTYELQASSSDDRDRWVALVSGSTSTPPSTRERTITSQLGVPRARDAALPPAPSEGSDSSSDEADAAAMPDLSATRGPSQPHLSTLGHNHSQPPASSSSPTAAAAAPSSSFPAAGAAVPSPLSTLQRRVEEKQAKAWEEALRLEDLKSSELTRVSSVAPTHPTQVQSTQLSESPPPGLTGFEHALWTAFTLADKNRDGMLSRLEFTQALLAVGVIRTRAEARAEWIAADSNASGWVEWSEFCAFGMRRQQLGQLAERLGQRPDVLDRAARLIQGHSRSRLFTGSGKAEQQPALGGVGTVAAVANVPPWREDDAKWLEELRADEQAATRSARRYGGNKGATGRRMTPPGICGIERALWASFLLADTDASGHLSRWEFTQALLAVGVVQNESDARLEWARCDRDASGHIEWEEFRQLGQRRKALCALCERLRVEPRRAEHAARLIQRSSRKRLQLGVAVSADGQIRPQMGTERV